MKGQICNLKTEGINNTQFESNYKINFKSKIFKELFEYNATIRKVK